ncbi:MAG: hypothetical protein ABIU86_12790 [Gemmatimonadaceae bacterium]
MTTRAKRREPASSGGIEQMQDDELQQIRFFGNLAGRDGTILFTATAEDQRRAVELLEARGTLH